jgi:hypothetical protein
LRGTTGKGEPVENPVRNKALENLLLLNNRIRGLILLKGKGRLAQLKDGIVALYLTIVTKEEVPYTEPKGRCRGEEAV